VSVGVRPAVPEPSTWAMMILGFLGVGFMAYRREIGFWACLIYGPLALQRGPPPAVSFFGSYLSEWARASLRRSAVHAMPAPIAMTTSVALKLPGTMQFRQVPITAGASCMGFPFRISIRPGFRACQPSFGNSEAGCGPRSPDAFGTNVPLALET
jgi:hypothetical protein